MENIADTHPLVKNAREDISLLYSDNIVSSYTENIMRGDGVLSLYPEAGQTIKCYTPEGHFIGEVRYNDDLTFTLKMPAEIIARKFVPNSDFMAFEFDAVHPDTDREFIFIYLNKSKIRIKKNEVSYTFASWKDYVKYQIISLKPNNTLHVTIDNQNALLDDTTERVYQVKQMDDNIVHLASTASGCCSHHGETVEGWVRWRYDDVLLIDFASD